MSVTHTQVPTGGQLQILPPDRWVVERKFRAETTHPPEAPYTVLLADRQYYIAAGACFVRHVRQVHREEAVARLGQIKIPFNPESDSLTIHWIRIWRDGTALELLGSEQDLTLAQSAGSKLFAEHVLMDLRPGDCIDVAYSTAANTRPGDNRFSCAHQLNLPVPVEEWHLSAISPNNRRLSGSCRRAEFEPTIRELSEGSLYYHWHRRGLKPAGPVSNVPTWHRTAPELQVSNFQSWTEVASEINQRWNVRPPDEEIRQLAVSIAGDAEFGVNWETAQALCRFVQDSIANAESSRLTLAPADPTAELIARGTADAQAKSCLLVTLLRSAGIPSAPVLVSKQRTRSIRDLLPAPDFFDHALVRGRIGDEDFWIDPGASHEGGSIREVSLLPPYGVGLQISARTKNLCAIPAPRRGANKLTTTEHFATREDGSAKLAVTTRALGTEANEVRASIADSGLDAVANRRLEELQQRHPGATSTGELSVEDDLGGNEIVLRELFEIPVLFSNGRDKSQTFSPHTITRNISAPPLQAAATRNDPWAISYPCNVRHHIVIDSQWSSPPEDSSEDLPGTAFAFSFRNTTEGKRHKLSYAYDTLDDHIVPVDFPSALLRLEKLQKLLSYTVMPPAAAPKQGKGRRLENGTALRDRKSNKPPGSGFLMPALGCLGAIALVLGVRTMMKKEATELRQSNIENLGAERPSPPPEISEEEEVEPVVNLLPDNPLHLDEPLPPLPGPKSIDKIEFGIDDGSPQDGGDSESQFQSLKID